MIFARRAPRVQTGTALCGFAANCKHNSKNTKKQLINIKI